MRRPFNSPSAPGRPRRQARLWAVSILAAVSVTAAAGCWSAVRFVSPTTFFVINESRSLPRGLYRMSAAPIDRGAIVAIVPPPSARAYIQALGAPADARLLKRVAALEGDLVCKHEAGLEVRTVTLAVAYRDRQGRPLPNWPECRHLVPNELLVLGDSPDSFDSRYFGPVPRSHATGPYVEVMRW